MRSGETGRSRAENIPMCTWTASTFGGTESDEAPGGGKEGGGRHRGTLTYCDFPPEHWLKIRTNNVIERLNREIRQRTRVVGCFPDGNSALMLVCARLRHVAGTQWGNKKYMSKKHLKVLEDGTYLAD